MKEAVSIELAISMWTARIVKQVNKTPYFLMILLPRLTLKGPKQSTPTYVKGGSDGVTRSTGRLAIFC